MPIAADPEWLQFLMGTHVAVVGVGRAGAGPLLAPVWYEYDPAEGFRFVMSGDSAKARRLRAEGRATLCIQEDRVDYQFVVVEGPVSMRPLDDTQTYDVLMSMADRYFGPGEGAEWAANFSEPNVELVTLVPERWIAERPGDPRAR